MTKKDDFFDRLKTAVDVLEKDGVPPAATTNAPIKTVVLISGVDPILGITTNDLRNQLEAAGAHVISLGDGKAPVSDTDIEQQLAALNKPATLMILGHGSPKDGKLHIELDSSIKAAESAIFPHVGSQIKGIVLLACYGGSVMTPEQLNNLPTGTEVRIFSAADDVTTIMDILTFSTSLPRSGSIDGDFSAANIYRDFLSSDHDLIQTDSYLAIPSQFGIAGEGVYDLTDTLEALQGHAFSKDEKTLLIDKLAGGQISTDQLETTLRQITAHNIDSQNIHLALTVADVLFEQERLAAKDLNQNDIEACNSLPAQTRGNSIICP